MKETKTYIKTILMVFPKILPCRANELVTCPHVFKIPSVVTIFFIFYTIKKGKRWMKNMLFFPKKTFLFGAVDHFGHRKDAFP